MRFPPRAPIRVLLLLLLAAGCGSEGPERFSRSGRVTYEGRPVPHGEIRFTPDRALGQQGPGVIAPIVDGRFQTLAGKGTLPGPHQVRVLGFDGRPLHGHDADSYPTGRPLFEPKELSADFPPTDSSHEFELTTDQLR